MEKSGVLSSHHQAHGKKGENHGKQAQKPHFPVKEKQHYDGGDWRDDGSRQIREFVSQQIFCESGVVINQFPETP